MTRNVGREVGPANRLTLVREGLERSIRDPFSAPVLSWSNSKNRKVITEDIVSNFLRTKHCWNDATEKGGLVKTDSASPGGQSPARANVVQDFMRSQFMAFACPMYVSVKIKQTAGPSFLVKPVQQGLTLDTRFFAIILDG